jgi:hypothetical protein
MILSGLGGLIFSQFIALSIIGVPFKEIDITVRGNEDHRDFMREKALERTPGINVLPPQIIYNDEYLGVRFIQK